jgi:lambda family phage portal protein
LNFVARAANKARSFTADILAGAYDAVASSTRRRDIPINLRSEERVLRQVDRDKLISANRTLRRNASIVAWAIRKHLDYVSTFTFQCRTDNPEVNGNVESLISDYSRPENCDVTGRFTLAGLTRMAEAMAITDGDCLWMKLSDGRVQLIEGDRVRTPNALGDYVGQIVPENFYQGVERTDAGRPTRYAICDRAPYSNLFTLRTVLPAKYVLHYGYFDRYDQTRGISPLASAVNTFCDIYEASEYALAKMKLTQLFALKLKRAADVSADGDTNPYKFDFGKGPQVLDLDPGDDAGFLESETPSVEFQQFMSTGIAIGLKSLDIPYSFFDESHTNYSGARQALLQYEQSAEQKRRNLRQLLNNLTTWRLGLYVADGELVLPAGMTVDDLKWEWVGAGLPWIDPQKEATADAMLINSGLKSRTEITKERGRDWKEVADELAAEQQYLAEKNVAVTMPSVSVNVNGGDNADNADGKQAA